MRFFEYLDEILKFQRGNCGSCHYCIDRNVEKQRRKGVSPSILLSMHSRMIVCIECGNKRCPKATDHKNDCTHSNDPGQPGSIYTNHPFES